MVDNISNTLWLHIVISNYLLEIVDKWRVPLIRGQHHLYVHLDVRISRFYPMQYLRRLHRQFAHLSPVKVYNILRKAGLEAVDSSTLHHPENIVAQCDPFQHIGNAPYRFRVTLGQEHTRFNRKLYMDLMHIANDYILHLGDKAALFSAARLVRKRVTTEKVWLAIIPCWYYV